jgi:hypothetical protein
MALVNDASKPTTKRVQNLRSISCEICNFCSRFHILTAVSVKMAVFWGVAPCKVTGSNESCRVFDVSTHIM